ncbi:MAG: RNA polymerase sigma factor [Betaproteobacteria bacterium]|nr:RNA polymerase sigma factor [Betaproteobacteria bacterium]
MPLTDPSEDLALLNDMRRGNAAAFEALYRRHQAPLYRFALLRCDSADTAADIVQEIFLALLSNSLKFDPTRGVLQGFLFGVARNLVLKREEAQYRFVSTSRDDEEGDSADDVLDPAPQPQQRLLNQQQAETVRQALAQLAPHYRDVVILYEMHDLSYVEIAQICNIDIGTVRSRLSRARAKLVEMLEKDFPEEAPTTRQTHSSQQEARL